MLPPLIQGSAFNHRRNERDIELEEDKRDRKREKEDLETLRLEVMERQLREIEEEKEMKKLEEKAKGGWTVDKGTSLPVKEEEEEEMVVKSEIEENLPLAKNMGGGFVPIQVN